MSAKTSWTPGPWAIGAVDHAKAYSDWNDLGGYRIDAPGVEQICYVWNASTRINGGPFGTTNGEADANLIAAAPELYEALVDADMLLKLVARISPLDEPRDGSIGDKIRCALAKARGEA